MSTQSKCPFSGGAQHAAPSNAQWWPQQLNLKLLDQHAPLSNPYGANADYAKAF